MSAINPSAPEADRLAPTHGGHFTPGLAMGNPPSG